MTDLSNTPAAPAAADAGTVISFELPNLPGTHTFDCATIPAEARLDLLKGATRSYIANRVNAAFQRHQKDEDVKAWAAYDEAVKADPLQSAVAMPTTERPAAPDLAGALARALEDLTKGEIRRQGKGEPKARVRKDPLVALVTKAVVKDVYESDKATDPKASYLSAQKKVGPDGIAYLNALIEAKVAAGVDRAALEKMREEKYIKPAKLMLGITENKAIKELPSIL